MANLKTEHFGYQEEQLYLFRETFTGNGVSTTFQLTGNVGNAVFEAGAWAVGNVETAMASYATKTTGAKLYDSLLPLVRHEITVSSISGTGLVTLAYAPLAENFYVWYWYDLEGDALSDYYRDEFVAGVEGDSGADLASEITVDTAAFAGLLDSLDNTVQKALDSIDDLTISSDYGVTGLVTAGNIKINTPQNLQTTASPTFANTYLGIDDNTAGTLYVYGNSASVGGTIRLYCGANNDSTTDYWLVNVVASTFYVGTVSLPGILSILDTGGAVFSGDTLAVSSGGTQYIVLDAANKYITVGNDDVTTGGLRAYGPGAGDDNGGYLWLYLAADHDASIHYYTIRPFENDLTIGYFGDTDILKLTYEKDLHITAGTVSCYDLTDTYFPYHVSDAAGLADSYLSQGTGTITQTYSVDPSTGANKFILSNPTSSNWSAGEYANEIQFIKEAQVTAFIRHAHTRGGGDHSNDDGGLVFGTAPSASPTSAVPVMVLDSLGRLGIALDFTGGTYAPSSRLHVRDGGTTATQVVTVTQDDANVESMVLCNYTYSTDPTIGLHFKVLDSGYSVIDWNGTVLQLGSATRQVLIGTATPSSQMTTGLLINQAGADNEILVFQATTDIAHPFTSTADAGSWATFQKGAAGVGGLQIRSFTDADNAHGMILQSWMGPTSVGTSYGMCVIRGGKWNGSAAPSDALTALADDNGLLFVQSLTDTKFAVYADGHLGIGGNASHTDDLINVSYTPVDDTGANALQIAYSPYSTQSASYSYVGVNLTMTSSYVATGTTNSGTWIGIQANAYSSSANFAGTLTTMEGFEVSYGMNTGVGAATITNLYGIYLQGYYVTGTTVGNVYELYMGATTTGTLTGTHYGIYQVSTTGVNWFAKKTVIGASGGVAGSTFNTRGLVLNQTTYDDEILSLQSSDVAHALTALTDTATYGGFSKISATLGGLMIRGFSDGDGSGLSFRGYIGSTDPTDTMPAIALRAGKSDGSTGIALLGSTETVFSIMNLTRPVFNMLGYGTLQIGELDGYREATDEITATFGATVHGLSLAAGVAYYKAGVIDLSSYAGTEGSATRYLIRVHDSASKLAYGYIGAADAAETLSGSELVVNGNFETFTGTADDTTSDNLGTWTDTSNDGTGNHIWVLTANPAPHGGTYCVKYQRDSSTNAQSYQNFAVTAGKLYKVTFWTQGDGTNAGRYALYDVTAGATITGNLTTGVTAATWTQVTHYITAPAGCASMRLYFLTSTTAGSFFVVDDASVQEVTHVGATGVHIVSAINGSTRDWTSIESGFNYNDSAYTFEVMDTQLPIKILTTQVGYFDPFGLVLGAGGAGIDYRLKFDGETNDGVITWKEDENWFEFTRPIRMATSLYRRYYHMPVTSADPGASGATWVDPGANSTGGWQLNAAGETLVGQADVHGDWDGASDLQIEVRFYVNVDNLGGGAGDTVDLKGVVRYKGTGDTTVKSQTVEVPTTVGACAQYTAFVALITIDWDYAANVVEVGDNLSVVVNLETDTSEVDDVVITGLSFSYLTTHVGIENGDE